MVFVPYCLPTGILHPLWHLTFFGIVDGFLGEVSAERDFVSIRPSPPSESDVRVANGTRDLQALQRRVSVSLLRAGPVITSAPPPRFLNRQYMGSSIAPVPKKLSENGKIPPEQIQDFLKPSLHPLFSDVLPPNPAHPRQAIGQNVREERNISLFQ